MSGLSMMPDISGLFDSPEWLSGQFSVALRELEQAAAREAMHPSQFTACGVDDARKRVFDWLDLWWNASQKAAAREKVA